jgi:hypothetical protein
MGPQPKVDALLDPGSRGFGEVPPSDQVVPSDEEVPPDAALVQGPAGLVEQLVHLGLIWALKRAGILPQMPEACNEGRALA